MQHQSFAHIVCSIWPKDKTLSVDTTLGQSGLENNGNVEVLHILKFLQGLSLSIREFCVI